MCAIFTLLTKPAAAASRLSNFRPVKHNSRAKLWLPMTFGKRCSAPTSAAIPKSTSFNWNHASSVQYLISAAVIKFSPKPTHAEWMPTMTGFKHTSRDETASYKRFDVMNQYNRFRSQLTNIPFITWADFMVLPINCPRRPTSSISPNFWPNCIENCKSNPAVKCLPAPDSTMARQSAFSFSWSKHWWSSLQMRNEIHLE